MAHKKSFIFHVNTIKAGQIKSYGDSFYHYEIETEQPEYIVKLFCMNVLKSSYEKNDMPNAFSGELLEFQKTSYNTYVYKVRTEYTG